MAVLKKSLNLKDHTPNGLAFVLVTVKKSCFILEGGSGVTFSLQPLLRL